MYMSGFSDLKFEWVLIWWVRWIRCKRIHKARSLSQSRLNTKELLFFYGRGFPLSPRPTMHFCQCFFDQNESVPLQLLPCKYYSYKVYNFRFGYAYQSILIVRKPFWRLSLATTIIIFFYFDTFHRFYHRRNGHLLEVYSWCTTHATTDNVAQNLIPTSSLL